MFNYYPDLYAGPAVKDMAFIQDMLRRETAIFDTYLLCVSREGGGLMDIFSCAQFLKNVKRDRHFVIVGIANGRMESRQLFLRILADYLDIGLDLQGFKAYFTDFTISPGTED